MRSAFRAALCAGLGLVLTTPVSVRAQFGTHPPMPGQQFHLQVRLGHASSAEVISVVAAIPLVTAPADLDQSVALPKPYAPVKITKYFPKATMEQDVATDPSGKSAPAIKIAIVGAKQSFERWLIAGDAERNRMTSLIGTWRYMAVDNREQRGALHTQFEREAGGDPQLVVTRTDGSGSQTLGVKVGRTHQLDELGCEVRVKEFFPHFALNESTKKPMNQSDERSNPAVLVEIQQGDRREERWIFSKYPDFGSKKGSALPFHVTLDCPLNRKSDTPDFVVLSVDRKEHELWTRYKDETSSRPIATGDKTPVSGSSYSFSVAAFTPSGRLVEKYRPAEGRSGQPTLRVVAQGEDGKPMPVWLELGKARTVTTPNGRLTLLFAAQPGSMPGGHP